MPKDLRKALEKTQELWQEHYETTETLLKGDCPLCKFFNRECEQCIVKTKCNALTGYSYFDEKRTLFGELVDARDKLQALIFDAITYLKKTKGELAI